MIRIHAATDIDEFIFKLSNHNLHIFGFFGNLKTKLLTIIFDSILVIGKMNSAQIYYLWNEIFFFSAINSFFSISIIRSIFTWRNRTLNYFIYIHFIFASDLVFPKTHKICSQTVSFNMRDKNRDRIRNQYLYM